MTKGKLLPGALRAADRIQEDWDCPGPSGKACYGFGVNGDSLAAIIQSHSGLEEAVEAFERIIEWAKAKDRADADAQHLAVVLETIYARAQSTITKITGEQ